MKKRIKLLYFLKSILCIHNNIYLIVVTITINLLGVAATMSAEKYITIHKPPAFVGNHSAELISPTVDAAQPIHIMIGLYLNDEKGLDEYIGAMLKPGNQYFRKKLKPDEIATRYGPSQGSINNVVQFLSQHGFRNITVASNHMQIEADASAEIASNTFQTTLALYRAKSGRIAHTNTSDIKIPLKLSGIVSAVLGLDTTTEMHLHSIPTTTTGVENAILPVQFPSIYDVGNTPTGSNTTVGIIASGDLTQTVADFNTFIDQNALPFTPVETIYINSNSGDISGSGLSEYNMDSQAILGMSGGVKKIIFYIAPKLTNSDLALTVNAAVSANGAQVINMSIGGCELDENYIHTMDTYFKMAISQGQTFVLSSGDTGNIAYGCINTSVEYPASSPYVVAVGGTTLFTTFGSLYSPIPTQLIYSSEVAWSLNSTTSPISAPNDASGGGISQYENAPSWQTSSVMPPPPAGAPPISNTHGLMRGIPDIAFDANSNTGIQEIVNGKSITNGGTSLAAPLFSAVWARYESANGNTLGFAAPLLYRLATFSPNVYNDITLGFNGLYRAGPGWDYVTGFGTLDIAAGYAAISALNKSYTGYAALFAALQYQLEGTASASPSCAYSLQTSSQNLSSATASLSDQLTTGANCVWNIQSDSSWLQLVSTLSGEGNTNLQYNALANTLTASRTGNILVLNNSIKVASVNVTQSGAKDTDGDGVADVVDNCILVPNPNQQDSDNDNFGNICDADLNNDCKTNSIDLGLFKHKYGYSGVVIDSDFNGDGHVNSLDLGLFKNMYGNTPGPSGLARCN